MTNLLSVSYESLIITHNPWVLFISLVVLVGLGRAASFEKCEAIAATENESEKGPKCADETCQRRCNPGYTAVKPTKVDQNAADHNDQL